MASGGTEEETTSHMEASTSSTTSTNENISAEETCENKGKTIPSSKASAPTRSIDLYRGISSGGKQIHIQILAGTLPFKDCQDTQAIALCRFEHTNAYENMVVLQEAGSGVLEEHEAAKTKGGKYVSKGVILTSAGRNPGYLLHLTFHYDHDLLVKDKETFITALRVAEKHEIKSVAFPPYLSHLFGIDQFIELIEEFAELYHPVCVSFVQLYLTEMQFNICQTMRKSGQGSSRLILQTTPLFFHK